MNLSAVFIKRSVATVLLTIGVTLAGIVAFGLLPVSPLPQVDFPTISVTASLPGASPETMAASVATPLERSLGRIAGVTEMTSNSTLGSTRITLQFDLSRDINGAARDVQAAINAARSLLPSGLPSNPTYRKVNPASAPVMILALTSDSMTRGQMYDSASTILAQKISQLDGVGDVTVGGSSLPAVRVELNPTALNKYQIPLETVRTTIQAANANRPKGALEDGDQRWQILANDQAKTAKDYLPVVVSYRDGRPVRLSDVADVVDSVQDLRNAGSANGKPSVVLIITTQPGANIIKTVDGINKILPVLRASIPAAINLDVVMDRTPTIRASLKEVERTLLISIALVIMVVFLFLRNWRATLIPSVAVPVSLIGTFGVMYLCGFSLWPESVRRRAQGHTRSRLHGALDEHFAGGGFHPAAAHGRHRGAPVPRVRRHALGRYPGLVGRLAHSDADDVRASAQGQVCAGRFRAAAATIRLDADRRMDRAYVRRHAARI